MLRVLLTLLAVLVPGLAFLFNRPWLNMLTVVIVVGALGGLGWWLWTTAQDEGPERPRPEPEDTEASVDEFGIVDIQPQGADDSPSGETADEADAAAPPQTMSGASAPVSPARTPATAPPSSAPSTDRVSSDPTPADAKDDGESFEEAPILGPLLESARAAIEARTVCLLVQEEVALTYRIEALASTHTAVRHSGTFDTQTPLLTATMSRESVTIRTLTDEELAVEDLGYYTSPPAVNHLAVAPVSRPDESSSTFLLVDASEEADLGTSRVRSILEHYTDSIAFLLSQRGSSPPRAATEMEELENGQSTEPSSAAATDGESENAPRPRRDIIAEEMEAAQSAEADLALALVHLNRAESIARRGEDAVRSAEHLFQARLDQLLPNQRIERFGELTYGIFFRDGADAVEPQVADLETTMAEEEGELEGGVSVGVAVWDRRDTDPENLRTEATEALREAYETGTPTIVT